MTTTKTKIRYVSFKKWAGWKVRGTERVEIRDNTHASRLFYLTAQLEAPFWGGVQSYDGVGMSAGPIHNIAVHRNGEQGSLIKLLRHLEVNAGGAVERLYPLFGQANWYLAQDGRIRHPQTGRKIPGRDIVAEFAGPKGVAPRRGARSKLWALAFHELFSDPRTFNAQEQFALDWILNSQELLESAAYTRGYGSSLDSDDASAFDQTQLGVELDLAMCVYHSHSVNAPGKAKSVLRSVLRTRVRQEQFPARLIRVLARTKYGRWQDTPDNRNRYDRTRIAVSKSGLWPMAVVRRLMPKNF